MITFEYFEIIEIKIQFLLCMLCYVGNDDFFCLVRGLTKIRKDFCALTQSVIVSMSMTYLKKIGPLE